MTRFWWVRHGPTHKKTMIGWTDAPADLSDTLRLERLKAYLPENAVVVSSDLARCVKTAQCLTSDPASVIHFKDLREIHFGDWEDLSFAEISKRDPVMLDAFWNMPGDSAAPNGESWNMVYQRVTQTVNDLHTRYKSRDIIVVAHYGVILTQLQMATKMSAKAAIQFHIDNLSVTEIEHLDGDTWRVLGVNHKP